MEETKAEAGGECRGVGRGRIRAGLDGVGVACVEDGCGAGTGSVGEEGEVKRRRAVPASSICVGITIGVGCWWLKKPQEVLRERGAGGADARTVCFWLTSRPGSGSATDAAGAGEVAVGGVLRRRWTRLSRRRRASCARCLTGVGMSGLNELTSLVTFVPIPFVVMLVLFL